MLGGRLRYLHCCNSFVPGALKFDWRIRDLVGGQSEAHDAGGGGVRLQYPLAKDTWFFLWWFFWHLLVLIIVLVLRFSVVCGRATWSARLGSRRLLSGIGMCTLILLAQGWGVAASTGDPASTGALECTGLALAATATAWMLTDNRWRPRRAKKKIMRENGADLQGQQPSSLFFSNITAWGPQARRYFQSLIANSQECQYDAIGIAEHH